MKTHDRYGLPLGRSDAYYKQLLKDMFSETNTDISKLIKTDGVVCAYFYHNNTTNTVMTALQDKKQRVFTSYALGGIKKVLLSKKQKLTRCRSCAIDADVLAEVLDLKIYAEIVSKTSYVISHEGLAGFAPHVDMARSKLTMYLNDGSQTTRSVSKAQRLVREYLLSREN